ncbi:MULTISPECIES: sulfatase-like hydrolase/transferase [unclassified Alteromonas]|uniref:sulfatase-like hydrolase/transferase n=1 Tax=unclassified Alteromonas TaxID=2614992 RepID=UPI00068D8AC9|nr:MULTISPECIES: sulfatase-like hydrolase/transferase [unclassified Alteromonas]
MLSYPLRRMALGLLVLVLGNHATAEMNLAKTLTLNDENSSPNIFFIYTDDQAPWAIEGKNPNAVTPNLNRLAEQGMSFPNAYTTTPVCSPSRAGLLTSRYGFELGIDDWINDHLKSKTLTGHQLDLGLSSEFDSWPKQLQDNGYYNGLIGKWHLGKKPEYHPNNFGYNEFIGFLGGGTTPIDPHLTVNGKKKSETGLTVDVLTDHAIDFLERNKNKKFLLSLHYRAPHYPFEPVSESDRSAIAEDVALLHPDYPDLNKHRAKMLLRGYLASVKGIDRNVGRLMAHLDTLGLADNTVVIFTSDHGYAIGQNGIWHKGNGFWLLNTPPEGTPTIPKGQRPNLYDSVLKVPLIVRWPDKVPAGAQNLSTVSNLDFYPTIMDIARLDLPEETTIRGQSVIDALKDENVVTSTDYFAAYSTLHQSITGMRMYSDGKHKLVRDFKNTGRDEFYDLERDPHETSNLLEGTLSDIQLAELLRLDTTINTKMRMLSDPLISKFTPVISESKSVRSPYDD